MHNNSAYLLTELYCRRCSCLEWSAAAHRICLSSVHRRRSGSHSEGDAWRAPRCVGAEWGLVCGGVSPLQPTRGLGKRRELPSGVRGRAENQFWRILKATERFFLYLYDKNLRGTICISPAPNSGGLVPCVPPWSTPSLCSCLNTHFLRHCCPWLHSPFYCDTLICSVLTYLLTLLLCRRIWTST